MIETVDNRGRFNLRDSQRINQMLLGCTSLEDLSVACFNEMVNDNLLAHLGPSLRSLSLRGIDSDLPNSQFRLQSISQVQSLSSSQVHLLGSYCNKLESLHLSINFDEAWAREDTWVSFPSNYPTSNTRTESHIQIPGILEAIADNFPTVKELSLEISYVSFPRFIQFWRKDIRISDIWSYLWTRRDEYRRAHPQTGARPLKHLRIEGPSNTPYQLFCKIDLNQLYAAIRRDCFLLRPQDPGIRHVDVFEARLSTRDDEIDKGIATIICKRLEEIRRLAHEQIVKLEKVGAGRWIEEIAEEVVVPGDRDMEM
jgi:hypothetical protein